MKRRTQFRGIRLNFGRWESDRLDNETRKAWKRGWWRANKWTWSQAPVMVISAEGGSTGIRPPLWS